MKNIPERIYLNLGDSVPENADFRDLSEVTWSEDKVTDNDVEYALASQWVSVEERLPEPFVDVIAQLKGGAVFIAYHNGEEWIDRTEWKEFNPAFWLPIPQLNPEKEER